MNPARDKGGRRKPRELQAIQQRMKPEAVFYDLSETFKALGDLSRTKIIFLLSQAELSVGEVAQVLGLSPSAVSHQLRLLRNLRLVKVRRDGKTSFYSLDDHHIENLFREGLRHVGEE
jgi:DNA-binding transcriptional ArsR family regulator